MISIEFLKNETTKTIYNVYQWNYGRTLNIKGLDLNNDIDVQFSIDGRNSALVGHKIENDALIVPIPNQFLTNGGVIKDFKVYAYISIVDENSYRTVKNIVINVTGCPKPDDYVYTETEILTYRSLEERVTALEESDATSGTQSDWNQNDKNAPDYVRNRPFYTDPDGKVVQIPEKYIPAYSIHDLKEKPFKERTIVKKVYVEETTINLDSHLADIVVPEYPSAGEIVTILFDGKKYVTEVYDGFLQGYNAIIAKIEIDTGVFFYVFFDNCSAGVYPNDPIIGGKHTIKVYVGETAVKLDEKYIDAHDCFFVINLSWDDENETYSVDKTFAEIKEAYENGKEIKLLENNIYIYPLVEYYGHGFYFGSYLGMYNFKVIIWDDDEVDWFEEDDWEQLAEEFVSVPDRAEVGQVLVVEAVDENGKPTLWGVTDVYNKTEFDTIMAEYITDIDTLVGGESE